jgi:hypothetical protein
MSSLHRGFNSRKIQAFVVKDSFSVRQTFPGILFSDPQVEVMATDAGPYTAGP